ncbi:MAG: RNA methyltransferase [Chitinophagaceae bacterium]|nr:RNA methyltransferase [Chitinophagaceae bacterium]
MISKSHTKYIQSLQHKKFRDEGLVFIAEGPKVVPELLMGGKFICKELFALPGWLDANRSLVRQFPDTVFEEVKDFELEKISALATPHEVLAVFEQSPAPAAFDTRNRITLALDTIQDPGNLGTLIRLADWFGISHIVCSTGCADRYNPKVVQSTMGSLGRVELLYTPLAEWLQVNNKVKRYGAALDGTDIKKLPALKEGIIVIGNEAHGISTAVMDCIDEKITIRKFGIAESLNAAVAAGIILHQVT